MEGEGDEVGMINGDRERERERKKKDLGEEEGGSSRTNKKKR